MLNLSKPLFFSSSSDSGPNSNSASYTIPIRDSNYMQRLQEEIDKSLEILGQGTTSDNFTSTQKQDTKPTWTNYPADIYGKSSGPKPPTGRAQRVDSLKEELAKKRNIPPNKRR